MPRTTHFFNNSGKEALDVVGGSVVHPELLNRHAEGDDVEQGRDPAVQRVLKKGRGLI